MERYIVTETALYVVEANSPDEALDIYLEGGGEFLVVTGRDVERETYR